ILPAVQRVRETANRLVCQNNLRQIGMALHVYYQHHDAFPPATQPWGTKYPFMNWTARLLPYLEQTPLLGKMQYAYDQDWRFWSPPHIPLRTTVIPLYICPSEGRNASYRQRLNAAYTHYLGVSGDRPGRGIMFANSRIRTQDI